MIGDILDGIARHGMNSDYSLLKYIPYTLGAVHLLSAANTRVKLQWPKKVPSFLIVISNFV
jgi:hypothetical protein